MHKNRLKVGVCGVGSLGQHHTRIYSEMNSVELAGIYDVDRKRACEIAAKHGTRPFGSIEEFASSVEAASVVVPTAGHFEVSSNLMNQGVHVLVEKPIASTTKEAEAMVAVARRKEVVLQVGHVERFNPVMQFLEDTFTQPLFIEVVRLSPYPQQREATAPRGTEVSVVLDLMIHDLDIILHLVRSAVKEIHAVGVPVLSPTEDIANVRITFENRCVANVTASRISQERLRKIRVFQRDTYVSLDYIKQSGRLYRKTDSRIAPVEVPIEKEEPLAAELSSFVQCVLNRHDPVVTGTHAYEALKLAVEICRCMRENPS